MGASFFPVFDRKLKTDFIQGVAIADSWDAMDRLAKRVGIKPLGDFLSVSFAELSEFIDDPEEAKAVYKRRPEKWFAASSGLTTIRALIRHLEEKPRAVPDSEAVIEDLKSFQSALQRAKKAGIRWHLSGGN